MKKETVIGTIGNTHGVKSMANPHNIASSIRDHRGVCVPWGAEEGEEATTAAGSETFAGAACTEDEAPPKDGTDEDLR